MKKWILLILFLSSTSLFGKVVYLDCDLKVTSGVGDKYKTGDSKLYKVDIDFKKETAKIPALTPQKFVTNPADPQQTIAIADSYIRIGTPDMMKSIWYFRIDRETLEMTGWVKFSLDNYGFFGGECGVVKERKKNNKNKI